MNSLHPVLTHSLYLWPFVSGEAHLPFPGQDGSQAPAGPGTCRPGPGWWPREAVVVILPVGRRPERLGGAKDVVWGSHCWFLIRVDDEAGSMRSPGPC